ncbi:MAG TPA: hypothetical protein VKY19_21530 [Ktedonosporobacter sp.]|jgi:membrane protein implicated in regulation of membrane protease activity|nr:hypothetical protein [Ktedonosporobacter sp.]
MPKQHRIAFVGLWCLLVIVISLAIFTLVLLVVYPVVLAFWYAGVFFNLTEALCWLALDRRKSSDMPKQAGQEKRPKTEHFKHSIAMFLVAMLMLLMAVVATKSTLSYHIILVSPLKDGAASLILIWIPSLMNACFVITTVVSILYLQNYFRLTNTSVIGSQTKMGERNTE